MTASETSELARLILASTLPLSRREERFLRDMRHLLDPPSAQQERWLRDLHRQAVERSQHGGLE